MKGNITNNEMNFIVLCLITIWLCLFKSFVNRKYKINNLIFKLLF